MSESKSKTWRPRSQRRPTQNFTRRLAALLVPLWFALLFATVPAFAQPAVLHPPSTTTAAQDQYLQRAERYRKAHDLRREQLELTAAVRLWPESTRLRYAYSMHLVRRKNLSQALIHTTHSLSLNRDQPITANLHLLILDGLGRSADGIAWVTGHVESSRARPPLEAWSGDWVGRWTQVLRLGRKFAGQTNNASALALIDDALNSANPRSTQGNGH